MTTSAPKDQSGFTLVEIAVSVAILGVGLVSLIGLHTRMMSTYINEQNRFQAALSLQYIASILETEPEAPDLGSESEALQNKLEELGFFGADSAEEKRQFNFEGWEFEQVVEAIGLPTAGQELTEDAIRKVNLRVSWGPSDDEQFILVYFASNPIEIPQQIGGGAVSGATP